MKPGCCAAMYLTLAAGIVHGNCVCYDKDYNALSESIDVIARRLRKNGRIERDDLPQTMKKMCKAPENLISEINLRYARLADSTAGNDKTEVFAYDYEAVSEILDGASKDCDDEYETNEDSFKKCVVRSWLS